MTLRTLLRIDRPLPWVYDDGGRPSGLPARGDCVVIAIAIATGQPYDAVRQGLRELVGARYGSRFDPIHGTPPWATRRYLADFGWSWTPTMGIGTGCTVHLRRGELPETGPLICRVTKHITAVVDGVVRDGHDPTRDGTRCVYGYWRPGTGS